MKLSTRDITTLKILGIIVVLALMVVTMFYPELVRNPYSIKNIKNKQDEVITLNNQMISNESRMSTESVTLDQLRNETSSLESEYNRLQTGLSDIEFELHIPSILVTLEQQAKENNLEITIDYENIKTFNGMNESMPDQMEEEYEYKDQQNEGLSDEVEQDELNETEELGRGGEELIEEEQSIEESEEMDSDEVPDNPLDEQTTSLTENGLSTEHEEISEDIISTSIPIIHGVQVTTVKVNLNGSYENIRDYLSAIDEIDFIEHNIIDLLSYGDSVSAVTILNVFHTEEGGEMND